MSTPTPIDGDHELTERLSRDFADERRVRAGDDELIVRAGVAALARPRGGTFGKRTALFVAIAATLVVASAAAATSVWIATRHASPFERTQRSQSAPSEAKPGAPAHAAATRPAPTPPAVGGPEGDVPLVEPYAAPAAGPKQSAPAAVERTAASLFREASAARRAGDLGRARSLYTELQSSFATSSEARVSRVSLGKLLLGAGHAEEAERQFRSYLALGGGDLGEEALVGRADALSRLARRDDERHVWQELLARYPSSVYAPRARQRLGALGAGK